MLSREDLLPTNALSARCVGFLVGLRIRIEVLRGVFSDCRIVAVKWGTEISAVRYRHTLESPDH
jgi:hypothetical protein